MKCVINVFVKMKVTRPLSSRLIWLVGASNTFREENFNGSRLQLKVSRRTLVFGVNNLIRAYVFKMCRSLAPSGNGPLTFNGRNNVVICVGIYLI